MTTAIVTLPTGQKAQVTFDTPEQLDAVVNDLTGSSAAPAPAPSTAARGLGLGTREAIEGFASPVTAASDLIGAGINRAVVDPVNAIAGRQLITPYQSNARNLSAGLTAAGLPAEQTATERIIGAGIRGAASTLVPVGVSSQVAGPIAATLAAQPGIQFASGATGGASSQAAAESGKGPVGQAVAGLAGSAVPSLVATGIPALARYLARGSEANVPLMQQNIQNFENVGAQPSVGQATQNRRTEAVESLLTRTPGGAGVMANRANVQAAAIGSSVDKAAAGLSPRTGGEQAGKAIEAGVTGTGGFVEKFRAKQGELYDKLDSFIPADQPVAVEKTMGTLAKLNAPIPGAPNTSKFFQNQKIMGIEGALKADTMGPAAVTSRPDLQADPVFLAMFNKLPAEGKAYWQQMVADGTLPYVAVKKLRTMVGQELETSSLVADVPRSKWKALYGSLSDDLGTAAKEAGPQAEQAWSRANTYTRVGMARLDAIDAVVQKAGGPERIFQAATAGTREGATTLRAVMQSIPEDAQKTVTATVLRRLGRANPSVQNDLGQTFSTETFLTNWNRMSPEAKRVLFDRYGPSFRQNMDTVANVASNLRAGSNVWRQTPGTAPTLIQAGTAGAFALALVQGNLGTAGTIAGGVAASNLSARLMTNPAFVRWLATNSRRPVEAIPIAINQLAQQAEKTGDPDLRDAAAAYRQALAGKAKQ